MRKGILGLLAVAALPTTALAAGGHGFSWFMMLPGGEHLFYMYAALFIAVFLLVASAVVVGGRKTEEMVIPEPRFTLRNLFELILGFLQQLAEDIIGHGRPRRGGRVHGAHPHRRSFGLHGARPFRIVHAGVHLHRALDDLHLGGRDARGGALIRGILPGR
jgi:hypothetical protein